MRAALILLALSVACCGPTALAAPGAQPAVPVTMDGAPLDLDVPPVIENGTVLVPFRPVAEALGARVSWDPATQTIAATDGRTDVQLQVGSPVALWGGVPINLEVAPVLSDGRVLVPLRLFSEVYGCSVSWINEVEGVRIVSPPADMDVLGFYALGDSRTSSWTDLFGAPYPGIGAGNTDLVRTLCLGWYSVDGTGRLLTASRTGWRRPEGWEDVLKAAEACSLKTEMVIHAGDEDRTVSTMLADDAAVERLVEQTVEEAERYDGVNVDLEGLGFSTRPEDLPSVRRAFTRLVEALSRRLRPAGKTLTVTLHAPNSAYRGYDYRAVGAAADRIVVMAYDYGVAPEPLHLVREAVEAACESVPAERLVLGISVPSETADSMLAKIAVARRYGLRGIALWRLGLLGRKWETVRAAVKPRLTAPVTR